MKVTALSISDVKILEPKVFEDARGYFYESYNQAEFENLIGRKVNFVQDNHSFSLRNVLRGLHFQMGDHPQAKLVRVASGSVYDVAVDIRKGSPSFGMWVSAILSAENKKQMWIPEGFAHGFLVLSESAEFLYKTTDFYSPNDERCIVWDDHDLNIEWPIHNKNVIVSAKDSSGLLFKKTVL